MKSYQLKHQRRQRLSEKASTLQVRKQTVENNAKSLHFQHTCHTGW